jgi:F0F1-type ATP synthase assembly protein I
VDGQRDPVAPPARGGDGWTVITLLLAGVTVYGGLGWLLDRWLGTELFLPVGLLAGVAGAIYMVYKRF